MAQTIDNTMENGTRYRDVVPRVKHIDIAPRTYTPHSISYSKPSIEPRPKPETFHLFSNLPTELRLKIWQLAMPPPAAVFLDPGPSFQITSELDLPVRVRMREGVPSIMGVNHESRQELLKWYCLVHFKHPWDQKGRRDGEALCFNPDLDFLYYSHVPRGLRPSHIQYERWFSDLRDQAPHILARVREFEIRRFDWTEVAPIWRYESRTSIFEPFIQALVQFPGLKRLHIVLESGELHRCNYGRHPCTLTPVAMSNCQGIFTMLLDEKKDMFAGSKAPQVIVYPWQPLGAWKSDLPPLYGPTGS